MNLDLKNVMRSRGMLIASIWTKYSFWGWKAYVIKELLCWINFFPSLSLNHHMILYSNQLHVHTFGSQSVKIFHIITVDLNWRDLYMILFVTLALQSAYFIEYKFSRPWKNSAQFINGGRILIHESLRKWWPFHCKSFTCSSLTISKYAHIFSINSWLNERLYFFKDLVLLARRRKNTIKMKVFWRVLSSILKF